MNGLIKRDLYRYIGNDSNRFLYQLRYFLFTPGFQYIYFFRKASLAKFKISKMLFEICLKLCSFKFGIQIPSSTQIGEGLRISHFGTIVVNPGAVIGNNFSIAEGTLIGNSQGKKSGCPVIGDNVCMQANSVVVGGVRIGNHVLIAPGAFVNFDVPDNSIVIGNPGKIIQRDSSPTDKYNVYKV
ncbi:MAG: serine acetyltransferase [Bacteroidales bacterium]|nr:serine acetyltransferase [Bacteroidales bacterium]